MRWIFKIALLFILTFSATGCIRHIYISKGITCFRAHNYRQAFIYLKPAADRGNPDAQYAVGYMYYYGKGVVEDRRKAWCWIKRAAVQGQPDAVVASKILKNAPKNPSLDPFDPLIYRDPDRV